MSDTAQAQLAAARQMLQAQGVPITTENLNRASLHLARGDDNTAQPVFERAMERVMAAPTQRQVRQADTQRPATREGTGPGTVPSSDAGAVRLDAGMAQAPAVAGVRAGAMSPAVPSVPSTPLDSAMSEQMQVPTQAADQPVVQTQQAAPTQQQLTQPAAGTSQAPAASAVDEFGQPVPTTNSGVLSNVLPDGSLPAAAAALGSVLLRRNAAGRSSAARAAGDAESAATTARMAGTAPVNTTVPTRTLPQEPPPSFGTRNDAAARQEGNRHVQAAFDTAQRELQADGNARVVEALRDAHAATALRHYDSKQQARAQMPAAVAEAQRTGARHSVIDTQGGKRTFEQARDARRRAATGGRQRRAAD